jgi:hypothetical protein
MSMEKMPPGTKILADGTWLTKSGENALAVTVRSWWIPNTKTSAVMFSKAAFSSKERLAHIMAHELGHVTHNYLGLAASASLKTGYDGLIDSDGHQAIQRMTLELTNLNKWSVQALKLSQYTDASYLSTSYESLFNPLKFLIKKIIFPK